MYLRRLARQEKHIEKKKQRNENVAKEINFKNGQERGGRD